MCGFERRPEATPGIGGGPRSRASTAAAAETEEAVEEAVQEGDNDSDDDAAGLALMDQRWNCSECTLENMGPGPCEACNTPYMGAVVAGEAAALARRMRAPSKR
jgi:hypothetical protein